MSQGTVTPVYVSMTEIFYRTSVGTVQGQSDAGGVKLALTNLTACVQVQPAAHQEEGRCIFGGELIFDYTGVITH